MKILINSYNNSFQHEGGGIQMRIGNFMNQFSKTPDIEAKLFNKWEDKLVNYDIIHEFKATIESYPLLSFAKNEGLKIVISSVISQIHGRKIKTVLALRKYLPIYNASTIVKESLDLSDAIVAQTRKEALFINDVFGIPFNKIHVIPNGVNESILKGYDVNQEKDIIICVGVFNENKNQLSLIKAAKGTQFQIHFIGGAAINEQTYYNKCREEAKDNPNIYFHGWLPNTSDVFLSLYKRARVLALLSHHEIFGNSLIEGAACGANLLSTNVLPVDEYGFGSHCITVNPDSIDEIRDGLIKAYEMPLSLKMHDIAVNNFSWNSIAQQHVELYKSLIK